jgi:hypothetical protein
MAPLAPEELLIFFQSALIRTAETRNLVTQFSSCIALELVTPGVLWAARLQAGDVAIQPDGRQPSYRLNRDEEGE